MEEATGAFLGGGPAAGAVTDAPHHPAERAAGDGVAAERAGRCRRLGAAPARA
ncbi:hypothetical protein GTU99_23230 [Streptomyces sp. PRKS01-65]|nr:hypothetical protein [Streptomyces harenosi]NEY35061.1 hypothetical protein [Streptomyces harenosi]